MVIDNVNLMAEQLGMTHWIFDLCSSIRPARMSLLLLAPTPGAEVVTPCSDSSPKTRAQVRISRS